MRMLNVGEYLTVYLQGGIVVQGTVLPESDNKIVVLEDAIATYEVRTPAIIAISRPRTGEAVEKLYVPPETEAVSH